MLKLYLVRHGQDRDNKNDILNGRRNEPLTEKGIKQAKRLAERIKAGKVSFDVVYSSPLWRAYKTADIITDLLGINAPEVLLDLIERDFEVINCGT